MKIDVIDIGLVYRSRSARPLNRARVDELAASISEIGLLSPIHVKPAKHYRGADMIDAYDIVAGNHRYEAALKLKWPDISCVVIDADALHAELIEIDENLIRNPLTPAEEAAAIARRKAIYEDLHPETRHGGERSSRQIGGLENERFTAATAAATGKAERNIQRAAARGEALGDDIHNIAGTSLDKGVELDALAKMAPEDRKPLIERAKAGEIVSARQQPADNVARDLLRLSYAWDTACEEARAKFLEKVTGEA